MKTSLCVTLCPAVFAFTTHAESLAGKRPNTLVIREDEYDIRPGGGGAPRREGRAEETGRDGEESEDGHEKIYEPQLQRSPSHA